MATDNQPTNLSNGIIEAKGRSGLPIDPLDVRGSTEVDNAKVRAKALSVIPQVDIESPEDRQLLEEVIADSAVGIFAHFQPDSWNNYIGGFSGKIDQPIQDNYLKVTDGRNDETIIQTLCYDTFDMYLDRGVNLFRDQEYGAEAIGFKELEIDIYEEREIDATRLNPNRTFREKVFGKNKTLTTKGKKQFRTNQKRPYKHCELVANGKDEPVYRIGVIWYGLSTDGRSSESDVYIYLPKSTAEKLWRKIDKDPLFMRKVLTEIFIRKINSPDTVNRLGSAFSRTPGEKRKMYIVPPHKYTGPVKSPLPKFYREV